jgi:hypothetical protein
VAQSCCVTIRSRFRLLQEDHVVVQSTDMVHGASEVANSFPQTHKLCKSRLGTSTLPGLRREDESKMFVFVQGKFTASAIETMQGEFTE